MTYCVLCSNDTQHPSLICGRCEDNLKQWLHEIPERYDLLPKFILHGTVDRNPDAKAGPGIDAPAPMRLEVVDLLETRHGRHWSGLIPTVDRRGVVGTLHAHAERVRDERHLPPLDITCPGHGPLGICPWPRQGCKAPTVLGEAKLLQRHRLWIAEQDWVTDFHTELKRLHRQLGDAIGDHRPQPVGRCVAKTDVGICDGPLFQAKSHGVRCARCGDTWDQAELRRLGQLLGLETA